MGLINVDILEYVIWGGTIDASDIKNFIIKDLHIFLTSDLTIKGSVVFINCLVCLNNNNFYSDDTLIMKNCVISGGRISFDEENCKGFYAPKGYIQDCSVNGFIPNEEICVKEILHSDFFRCNRIVCGSDDSIGEINDCTFTKCDEIQLRNGCVHDCEFIKLSHIKLNDSILRRCSFEDSVCTDSPLITAMSKPFNRCIFKDIVLLGSSYLAELHGEALVDNCEFDNIRTSRKDKKLFIKADAPDVDVAERLTNCHGLENVKNLEGE